jgi:hypothetical protein
MPEKRRDSKIKSMLERKGLIKMVDDSQDATVSDSIMRYDSDIKPLFESPDDSVKVTPASRQPVPGMPSPVFPPKSADDIIQELSQPGDEFDDISSDEPITPEQEFFAEPSVPPPPPPPPPEPPKPAPTFGGLNPFRSTGPAEVAATTEPAAREHGAREHGTQQENYTERYLNINELYDALALRSKKTDTVYLIEEYLHTLPDSLPDAARREIVNKIIAASGFDYDLLMGDGVLRVKMLKEYAERFARHTDDYIAARQAEIDEMDQRILRTRRLIENRRELHKKQFYTIEAEAQRLKDILTFISG